MINYRLMGALLEFQSQTLPLSFLFEAQVLGFEIVLHLLQAFTYVVHLQLWLYVLVSSRRGSE